MHYHRFVRLAAVVVTPLALVGIGVTPAFSAGTTAGGTIHVWQSDTEDSATVPILVTGAIGDYGNSIDEDQNGTVDENGDYTEISLTKGTFLVNNTSLNKAFAHLSPTVDKGNCSVVFTGTASSLPISKGTGAYAGIKGTVRITVTSASIQPKLADGKCDFSETATPLSSYEVITGSGRVSF